MIQAVISVLGLIVLICGIAALGPGGELITPAEALEVLEREVASIPLYGKAYGLSQAGPIRSKINDLREQNGVGALEASVALNERSARYCDIMVNARQLGQSAPSDRAEVLLLIPVATEGTVLMSTTGNLLDPAHSEIGFAIAFDSDANAYVAIIAD